ncbi:amino acid ABC transporter substrate-binding protein [Vreelandella titanicae]|jgi:putative amino-acid transport system substrate-binding protein|uniref:Extracellular solute-binding protein, family 3 n=1 Tax=Vreelandella titanicae BH1 TaxID=1204738 RepID=L9U9G3_9GAMM|nr:MULTISPECIES: amino acid ABC transporter substrate-binding protein [Halomonas]ELY21286.1 Extracellular solute-binding protein, family 3 [Halomonas titanicae BH1]NVE92273.1 amino acid ABC transporter substrate-binding protein [Halomonas titanicae]PKH61756.1 amino acid ABC transporter substrate-binding protein [Halomonas sp. Choline-3u-9]
MPLSRKLNLTLAALSLSVASGVFAASAQADTLRVGMSGGYFPFTFVEQDELKGFEVDVMNAVGEITGDDIEFVTASFSGLAGMLESGRIDTIANQITITPEREAKYVFTSPYVYDGAQVVVRAGNDTIEGVEDLSGKSVAVNLGSNYEQLLREQPNADEIDIRTYESNIEQDVALGRVEAFVMDRVSATQVIKEKGLPLELAGQPFSTIENALPFRDDEAGREQRDRVDTALSELRENGELREISEKWFNTDITQP